MNSVARNVSQGVSKSCRFKGFATLARRGDILLREQLEQ